MSTNSEQLALLDSHIRDIPDFPKPGIIFKDITPLLSNAAAFTVAVDMLAEHLCDSDIDFIACPEARGFIWAAPLAYRLDAGITLIRKPGKLPADTIEYTFDLEYGSDALSIHADAFAGKPNPSVLIVDDVLATGGTAQATFPRWPISACWFARYLSTELLTTRAALCSSNEIRVTSIIGRDYEGLTTHGSVAPPTMKDPLTQKSLVRIEKQLLAR